MRSRIRNFRNRAVLGFQAFTKGNKYIRAELYKALRRLGPRAPAYAGRVDPYMRIIEPQWDYVNLYKRAQNHHVLRKIHEAIIRECTRNGGEVVERFVVKCVKCGSEFDKEVKSCPCGGSVKEPDPNQKPILQAFIKNPNRDDEWMHIIVSLLRFNLAVDDWYLQIANTPSIVDLAPFGTGEKLETNVIQLYVQDSRYMRIVADRYGIIGNEQFFCPVCYDGEKGDVYYDANYFKRHKGKCKCGGELNETAYVWREVQATTIEGRFSRDEIIHGKLCSQLPHMYGMSKAIAALRPLDVTQNMTRFNLENYTTGKVAKMVFISGMNQTEVNTMVEDAKQQAENVVDRSVNTGQRNPPKLHTLTIGIDDPKASVTVVDAMPDPEKMQSLEWYKQYCEDICGIYGVTPKFEGVAEAGTAGIQMRVDVDTDVAMMYQKGLTDVFDEQLWPKYLGVTDWVWRFNPIQERDVLVDARTLQLNVDTVIKAARAKMNAEMEETGEVKISGKPSGEMPQFGEGEDDSMEVKVPGESPSKVETPWQKKALKKGKSFLVTELEEKSG